MYLIINLLYFQDLSILSLGQVSRVSQQYFHKILIIIFLTLSYNGVFSFNIRGGGGKGAVPFLTAYEDSIGA